MEPSSPYSKGDIPPIQTSTDASAIHPVFKQGISQRNDTMPASSSPPPTPSQKTTPPGQNPAVRTMESDMQRLFQTTPPSIAQMINQPKTKTLASKKMSRYASLYIVLGIMLMLFLAIGGGIYYFRDSIFPPKPIKEVQKATPPAPFFATETSRTIEVSHTDIEKFIALMQDSMQEFERDGTMKRILIRLSDTPDQRFITPSDFFGFYGIKPSQNLIKRLGSNIMLTVYTATTGTRLGLMTRTNDPNRTLRDMLDWESDMLHNLQPIFFGIETSPLSLTFEDRSYRNIDWRYLKLSSKTDIGIAYGIFPAKNILILTTSKGSIETIINRLFDAS